MNDSRTKNPVLLLVLAIGCIWGLAEALLGMFLRGSCAASVTGSLLTGMAILFLSSALAIHRRKAGLFIILGVVAMFKLLDAVLLDLPVRHGAIINPIFGIIMEVAAFALIFSVLKSKLTETVHGQAVMGGLSALVAVNLFPLVKYFTGIPACVLPGTVYPLSLYYAPIAVALSMVSCPLGFSLGSRLAASFQGEGFLSGYPALARVLPTVLIVASLTTFILVRTL